MKQSPFHDTAIDVAIRQMGSAAEQMAAHACGHRKMGVAFTGIATATALSRAPVHRGYETDCGRVEYV
jgi:hypothetical protein